MEGELLVVGGVGSAWPVGLSAGLVVGCESGSGTGLLGREPGLPEYVVPEYVGYDDDEEEEEGGADEDAADDEPVTDDGDDEDFLEDDDEDLEEEGEIDDDDDDDDF